MTTGSTIDDDSRLIQHRMSFWLEIWGTSESHNIVGEGSGEHGVIFGGVILLCGFFFCYICTSLFAFLFLPQIGSLTFLSSSFLPALVTSMSLSTTINGIWTDYVTFGGFFLLSFVFAAGFGCRCHHHGIWFIDAILNLDWCSFLGKVPDDITRDKFLHCLVSCCTEWSKKQILEGGGKWKWGSKVWYEGFIRHQCIHFSKSLPKLHHFTNVCPHTFLFIIASVLKLYKEIRLVETPFVSMDWCDFPPDRCSVVFIFDLKKSGFVDSSVDDFLNGCLHLVIWVSHFLVLFEFLVW